MTKIFERAAHVKGTACCGRRKRLAAMAAAAAMLALPSCWLAAQPIPCTSYDPSPQNGWPAINAVPSFLWRSFSIDSTLNFNGADYVNGNGMTFNNLPYSKNYTLVMVCKPQFNVETMLWNLDFGDSVTRGLSTEHILLRNCGTQFMSIWYGP